MQTEAYIRAQTENARSRLRAGAFLDPGKKALLLRGKTAEEFLSDLVATGGLFEMIEPGAGEEEEEEEGLPGDPVTVAQVFPDAEGMLFTPRGIRFRTPAGAEVSPAQYTHLQKYPLRPTEIFAEARDGESAWQAVYRSLTRSAREARTDRAKDILYLTVGELRSRGGAGTGERRSPLFLIPLREEATGRGIFKCRAIRLLARPNKVLFREVKKETAVSLFSGAEEELPPEELCTAISRVAAVARENHMTVEKDAFSLCILDSQAESICQAVEKNCARIAASPLAKVLSGEIPATEMPPGEKIAACPIFPLPADESQRQVVSCILSGQSRYIAAPAGTGKSQTSVNIAANLAAAGKTVCVMSEKLAANEVFLDYAARIGLDRYCLRVDNNTTVAGIARQVRAVLHLRRRYVDTARAKEAVHAYLTAEEAYDRMTREIYREDPLLRVSLYELIGRAVSAPALSCTEGLSPSEEGYAEAYAALTRVQNELLSTVKEQEYEAYLATRQSGDPELDRMFAAAEAELLPLGIDFYRLATENSLPRGGAAYAIRAAASRAMAMARIGEEDLYELGSRHIKGVFRALCRADRQIEGLYIAYLQAALCGRVSLIDTRFSDMLEKIKTKKISVQELFSAYGAEILSVFPIIITTPTAAATYMYDTGLDRFHTLIVDEASQMPIVSLLPFLDRTRTLAVFGDGEQLSITANFFKKEAMPEAGQVQDTAAADRSVLDAAQGRLPKCDLLYHYRSGTEMLIHVSNKTCYDGMLEVAPDIYTEREALPPHLGLSLLRVEAPADPGRARCNENEAEAILTEVLRMREAYPEKTVGIITLNEEQRDLLSDLLEDRVAGFEDGAALWVRSLENAQGKEADFIFISLGHHARTAKGELHQYVSNFNREGGENRMNVLFTRARCKMYIALSFDPREIRREGNPRMARLRDYLDYAESGRLHEGAGESGATVESGVIDHLADKIREVTVSHEVLTRIGSAGLSVDIAVKKRGDDRYAIGVLIPARAQSARGVLTKLKVLERAGWHLTPISPLGFLEAQGRYIGHIIGDIEEPVSFTAQEDFCFLSDGPSGEAFCERHLLPLLCGADGRRLSPLTRAEFSEMDLLGDYLPHLPPDMLQMDAKQLQLLEQGGDSRAALLSLLRARERYIADGMESDLMTKVLFLYTKKKEKLACYFLLALLRLGKNRNEEFMTRLQKEADEIGIGG